MTIARSGPLVVVLCLAAVLAARPALAYLDPGSGSMLTQLVLGGIAGLLVLIRVLWSRLRSLGARWLALRRAKRS